MKELVEFMAKSLVDSPEQVRVVAFEDEDGIRLELKVADEDVGKVIGRQGRIAKALRTVLKAAAVKDGRKISLEIVE
ncbi:MAG: KH domain-containing protein [Firmicutes bacterium]|nr:KH domain-containing protein [Bacillota bacterium]